VFYDIVDQLVAVGGTGAASFSYNANGDQLTAGANTFSYNTARQTVAANVGGVLSAYSYDGDGNRSGVVSSTGTVAEVWDTNSALPMLVAERDGGGVTLRRYSYVGSMPLRYDNVAGGQVGYYLTDGLGSVTNMTSTGGASPVTYRYGPYGGLRPGSIVGPGWADQPLRFTGQQLDTSGNYHLRARAYNPATGRFTQVDPLPSMGSAYPYANNNPMMFVDPSGKRGKCNTGLGRQFGAAITNLNPWHQPSQCEALAIDSLLGPAQVVGTLTASASCAIGAWPVAVTPGGQGYYAGIVGGCGALANQTMTNYRSGGSGGYLEAVSNAAAAGYLTTPQGTSLLPTKATKPGTAAPDPLDWSIVKQSTGETRAQHVQLHGSPNAAKASHGVFTGDPVVVTNEAWSVAQARGIQPASIGGTDIYRVPMGKNVGYAGGADAMSAFGIPHQTVEIVVQKGTNKIITAYPVQN
jgi:RHS repeat-associated protein